MKDANQLLNFWFSDKTLKQLGITRYQLWFGSIANVDECIRKKFTNQVRMAGVGRLHFWMNEPRSALALLILLDQCSRRIYRGLNASYRYDEFALALCKKGLALGLDHSLLPLERAFFFMPLMHSESQEDQEESLFRFSQLKEDAKKYKLLSHFFAKAEQNHEIIKQFGRFPQQNRSKGRSSTPVELRWLRLNKKGFYER